MKMEFFPKKFNARHWRTVTLTARGAKQGGGLGGSQPPLNFGWGGVEHLSTRPDFGKISFRGGWLPLY